MAGRQGGGLRLRLRGFLRYAILLDLAPPATGERGQQEKKGPPRGGREPLTARQQLHLMYLQVFRMKSKRAVASRAGKARFHLNNGPINALKTRPGLGGDNAGLPPPPF